MTLSELALEPFANVREYNVFLNTDFNFYGYAFRLLMFINTLRNHFHHRKQRLTFDQIVGKFEVISSNSKSFLKKKNNDQQPRIS